MNQDNLESRIKLGLQHNAEQIDDDTRVRLQHIRRHALSQPASQGWFESKWMTFKPQIWAPAAGLAFCSIFAMMMLLPSQSSNTNDVISQQIDQTAMMELIENPDDIDTLGDPDFYLWLDESTGT